MVALALSRMVRCSKVWDTSPMHHRDGVAVMLALMGVSSLDFGPLLREWPFLLF
jgi:hypothetical protein